MSKKFISQNINLDYVWQLKGFKNFWTQGGFPSVVNSGVEAQFHRLAFKLPAVS